MLYHIKLTSAEMETLQTAMRFIVPRAPIGFQLTKTRLEDLTLAIKSATWTEG